MADFAANVVRWAGIIAASIMFLSFVLFAANEGNDASKGQVEIITGGSSPTANEEVVREREHTKAREAIDDANDYLAKPFAWITENSSSLWAQRGVTMILGVLVYGLGLTLLANAMPKSRPDEPTAWQT